MGWNAAEQSGYQSTYGGGLGSIYQYGHAMPAGPYSFLPGGSKPATGGNSATTHPGATGGGTSSSSAHAGPNGTATDFYNSVLSGQQMPYTQGVQDSMLSDASDQTAAAETAQHQSMVNHAAANGGSAGDPSMQGSSNEAAAARQAGNVKAKRDISMQADQANFGAKQNAASHLMDYDLQQQGFQNGMQKTALGFLPFNQGGGKQQSGGNNFGGTGMMPGFNGAQYGDFNPETMPVGNHGYYGTGTGTNWFTGGGAKPSKPNQYGQYQSDSYYEDMGL